MDGPALFVQTFLFALVGLALVGAVTRASFRVHGRFWRRRGSEDAAAVEGGHGAVVWRGVAFGPRTRVPGDLPAAGALVVVVALLLAAAVTLASADDAFGGVSMAAGVAALVGAQILTVRRSVRSGQRPREVVIDDRGTVHVAPGRRERAVRAGTPAEALFRDADGGYALVIGEVDERRARVLRLVVGTVADAGVVRRGLARDAVTVVGVHPAVGSGEVVDVLGVSSVVDPRQEGTEGRDEPSAGR